MSYGSPAPSVVLFAVAKQASPTLTVGLLVLGVLFGVAAYAQSERFKKRKGVTPWRWPSFLWGIVGFISLLLWIVLFLIASRTTKAAPATGTLGYPGNQQPSGSWSKIRPADFSLGTGTAQGGPSTSATEVAPP